MPYVHLPSNPPDSSQASRPRPPSFCERVTGCLPNLSRTAVVSAFFALAKALTATSSVMGSLNPPRMVNSSFVPIIEDPPAPLVLVEQLLGAGLLATSTYVAVKKFHTPAIEDSLEGGSNRAKPPNYHRVILSDAKKNAKDNENEYEQKIDIDLPNMTAELKPPVRYDVEGSISDCRGVAISFVTQFWLVSSNLSEMGFTRYFLLVALLEVSRTSFSTPLFWVTLTPFLLMATLFRLSSDLYVGSKELTQREAFYTPLLKCLVAGPKGRAFVKFFGSLEVGLSESILSWIPLLLVQPGLMDFLLKKEALSYAILCLMSVLGVALTFSVVSSVFFFAGERAEKILFQIHGEVKTEQGSAEIKVSRALRCFYKCLKIEIKFSPFLDALGDASATYICFNNFFNRAPLSYSMAAIIFLGVSIGNYFGSMGGAIRHVRAIGGASTVEELTPSYHSPILHSNPGSRNVPELGSNAPVLLSRHSLLVRSNLFSRDRGVGVQDLESNPIHDAEPGLVSKLDREVEYY